MLEPTTAIRDEESCNCDREKQQNSTAVNKGWARRRIGKLKSRSLVMAVRNRMCVLRITSHTKSIPATAVP